MISARDTLALPITYSPRRWTCVKKVCFPLEKPVVAVHFVHCVHYVHLPIPWPGSGFSKVHGGMLFCSFEI